MPIYTKKGDKGETGLPGGKRLSKTDPIFECLGALDQTNALIGLAVSLIDRAKERELADFLEFLQDDLLSIGSLVATEQSVEDAVSQSLIDRTREMENQIDRWDKQLPELKNFILPGGQLDASIIHLARVSARQAERNFHRLPAKINIDGISMFLNRLSDYLFQSARYLNRRAERPDKIWKNT